MADIPHYKSFAAHELTSEQQHAVHLAVSQRENLKLNALAGTGKTSTLRAISHNLPHQTFLYLAFNKAVQLEASTTFPRNVFARTIHSLAYRAMGIFDARWQKKLSVRMTVRDYATLLGLDLRSSGAMQSIFCLREALREFQQSTDLEPSAKHIPEEELASVRSPSERRWIRDIVNTHAPKFWQAMIDPDRSDFAMTHDTYLKMWQLNHPRIHGVDVILLDEAQDANPVMIDILRKQNIRIILVGDTWQQIYTFRGAVNAMETFVTPLQCYLTQSFRFGQDIAALANKVLDLRSAPKHLQGFSRRLSAVGILPKQECYAMIFRYNIELLEEAIALASKKRMRIHIVGSLDSIASLALDVYGLFSKQKASIRDSRVKQFKSWGELESNYDILDDIELKKSFRFVERYGHEIPGIIRSVKKADAPSAANCNVILSTGHKSKGQEWTNVRISNDFLDALRSGDREELNLLYVAITRAIVCLEVPQLILDWIEDRSQMNAKAKADLARITKKRHSLAEDGPYSS